MHVFLDESGIHLKTGHSVYALVYVESGDLPLIDAAARQLEDKIQPSTFHWRDMSWSTRATAFNTIKTLPFEFRIAVINNPAATTMTITAQTLGSLLAAQDREVSAIYIDGRKPHIYETRLKKTLRDAGITTRKLKTVNDGAYPGIQLADSIAGLYRHQLDKPSRESARLQAMIASKQI